MTEEIEYIFSFPRCDAEKIRAKGATYGEAADKAIEIRTRHVTPLKADGEIYEQKPSLTNPGGKP
jgi:hypothetical protein